VLVLALRAQDGAQHHPATALVLVPHQLARVLALLVALALEEGRKAGQADVVPARSWAARAGDFGQTMSVCQ
jgi:hypothetical protein